MQEPALWTLSPTPAGREEKTLKGGGRKTMEKENRTEGEAGGAEDITTVRLSKQQSELLTNFGVKSYLFEKYGKDVSTKTDILAAILEIFYGEVLEYATKKISESERKVKHS